jgi:hypothetical protein
METVLIYWGDKSSLMKFNRLCNTIEENTERDKKIHGGCSSEEEHLIVVQDVVGSSPIIHPTLECSSVGLER